jgi:hypothetical protein
MNSCAIDSASHSRLSTACLAAQKAVKGFPECFWWWNDEFLPETREDVEEITRALRKTGGHEAWRVAQSIQKCL